MIRKIKRNEKPPLTSSKLFWTAFAILFGLFIYKITESLWQKKTIAVIFAVINLLCLFGWVYVRNIMQKQRLLANRNCERIFGYWLAFVLLFKFLLSVIKLQETPLVALLAAFLLSGLVLFFFVRKKTAILVSSIKIETPKLECDKIRIVHISDLHVGLWSGLEYLREMVSAVNKLEPDIIVCTGDLKDEQLGAECEEELTMLSKLEAKEGKFAVSGNHDYANIIEAKEFTEQSGFEVLDGRSVELSGIIITGAGDRDHIEKKQWGLTRSEMLILAYEFIQKENFLIVLRHRDIIEDGQKGHFDLQLSGYKNGISPLRLLLRKIGFAPGKGRCKKISEGGLLYRADGAGYIGVPVRVFCKPEIVLIDIVKAETKKTQM